MYKLNKTMDNNEEIINFLTDIPGGEDKHLEILRCLIKAQTLISGPEFIQKIITRMKLGRERYGHGLRCEDDTRQWGTQSNSWLEMCEEEILDGLVYLGAHHLRIKNLERNDIKNET